MENNVAFVCKLTSIILGIISAIAAVIFGLEFGFLGFITSIIILFPIVLLVFAAGEIIDIVCENRELLKSLKYGEPTPRLDGSWICNTCNARCDTDATICKNCGTEKDNDNK